MNEFLSVDEVQEILDAVVSEIPEKFFKGLNLGIILSEELKEHPQSINNSLYILGQYQVSKLGCQIFMYYGSFKKMFINSSREKIEANLRETLLHELTHHLEYRAGEKDLEIEDEKNLAEYLNKYKK